MSPFSSPPDWLLYVNVFLLTLLASPLTLRSQNWISLFRHTLHWNATCQLDHITHAQNGIKGNLSLSPFTPKLKLQNSFPWKLFVFWFARAYVIDPKLTYRIFSWKVLIYLVADILTNRKKLINAYKIFLFPNDWSSNEFIIHSLKTDMLACNKHLLYHLHWSETKGMYVG